MRLTLADCACYQFPNEAASYKCSIVRVPFGANDLVPSPEKSIMPTVGLRDIEVDYEDAAAKQSSYFTASFLIVRCGGNKRSLKRKPNKPGGV